MDADGGASAWGEMEVTFAVTETQDYEFSAYSYMFGDSPSGQRPRAEFSFSGANTGNVLGPRDFFLNVYGGPSVFSGVLLPDIYTFRIEHFVGGGNDPLGDHSEGEWDMRLSVSNAVPDAGSSALLLGVGLVGLLAFGGRRVAA